MSSKEQQAPPPEEPQSGADQTVLGRPMAESTMVGGQTVALGAQATPRPTGGSPVASQSFAPGILVGGRFRVIRFIAKGGMGEVYEAEDMELHERVALKTVLPEIAEDPNALKRFTREIALSRKVTHPNACRIFDVFHHHDEAGDIAFLSMELLSGEALSDYIRRKGPMPIDEILPMVQQMAGALGAAHQAGIVHRDFKPNNVMLVPSPTSPNGLRSVVTDFGLAQGSGTGNVSYTATAEGFFVGTPAYMAPEQVEGKPASPRSDIYALGLVIYEMVTGRVAFTGDNLLTVATARLTQAPPSPERYVPNLDILWSELIRRCLEKNPEKRWQTIEEILQFLVLAQSGKSTRMMASPTMILAALRPRKTWPVVLGVSVALVAGGSFFYWYQFVRDDSAAIFVAPGKVRPSIAVLGFTDSGTSKEWLPGALQDLLAQEFLLRGVRVLPADQVLTTRRAQKVEPMVPRDSKQNEELHRALGTNYVLEGSISETGKGSFTVNLRFSDTSGKATTQSRPIKGDEDDLPALVTLIGKALGEIAQTTGSGGGASLAASVPRNAQARKDYFQGLERLSQNDSHQAKELLQRALDKEPKSPQILRALARAWNGLGYNDKAATLAREAQGYSKKLKAHERAQLQLDLAKYADDPRAAIEPAQQLWKLFPDDPEYGLEYAEILVRGGNAKQAHAVLAELRSNLAIQIANDPRMERVTAIAYKFEGQRDKQLEFATKAIEKARKIGSKGAEAECRLISGMAMLESDRPEEALPDFKEALSIFELLQNPLGQVQAKELIAQSLKDMRKFSEAKLEYEQALRMMMPLDNPRETSILLNNMVQMEKDSGNLDTALSYLDRALEIVTKANQRFDIAQVKGNKAEVLRTSGAVRESLKLFPESIAYFESAGKQAELAANLFNQSIPMQWTGDLDGAEKSLSRSFELNRTSKDLQQRVFTQKELMLLNLRRGRVVEAQSNLNEITKWLGADHFLTKLIEANFHMLRGKPEEAMRANREALKQTREEGFVQDATAAIAGSLLELGRAAEAQKEVAPLLRTLLAHGDFEVRTQAQILDALLGATKNAKASLVRLEGLAEELSAKGIIIFELDARMAMLRIQAGKGGNKGEAKQIAQKIRAVAQPKGLLMYVKKAESLAG